MPHLEVSSALWTEFSFPFFLYFSASLFPPQLHTSSPSETTSTPLQKKKKTFFKAPKTCYSQVQIRNFPQFFRNCSSYYFCFDTDGHHCFLVMPEVQDPEVFVTIPKLKSLETADVFLTCFS